MGKENKAPPDRIRWEGSKSQTLGSQLSQDPLRGRAFGVSDRVNVKDGKPNANCSSSSRVSALTKVNPVLRRTYTVSSSKPNLSLKKQPNTEGHNPSKVQSNGRCTQVAKSDHKLIRSSSGATLCPLEMASSRISTGPLVKTKTGLVPAVIQPRNEKSNASNPPGTKRQTIHSTSVAKKGQSSRMSSVSVSQRPTLVLSTSRFGSKSEALNKSKPKPLPDKQTQPTVKSQLTRGLRSVVPEKCKPVKPEERLFAADRSVKLRPKTEFKKNTQILKAGAATISRTSVKCGSTAVKTSKQATLPKDGREANRGKEAQVNKEKTYRNIPSVHVPRKSTAAPVGSQTASQPSRSFSLVDRPTATKTPMGRLKAVPQTEVKKLTSAQEERMRKLKEWRESKGISYKRPPMPVKPPVTRTVSVPQPFWPSMKVEDEAHSLICAVDRSLADCIKLLAEGCPPDQVTDVLSRLPAVAQKFAKYWICQARLMEQDGNLDVLPMFEEAVRVVLEPVDELRTVVFDILKKKDEIQENEKQEDASLTTATSPDCGNNPRITPKAVKALIKGERRGSSVVKYKITATPGCPASQKKEPVRVNGQEVRFFTPVRRSVRIERASLRYPPSLQDHDVCVSSYNDLMSEEGKEVGEEPSTHSGSDTPMYIYRQNEALGDKVSVELILDDTF